jgi:hypothetical protein
VLGIESFSAYLTPTRKRKVSQSSYYDYITAFFSDAASYAAINSYSVRKPFNQTSNKERIEEENS